MANTYFAVTGDVNDIYTVTLGGIDNLDTVDTVVGHVFTYASKQATHVAEVVAEVNDSAACTIDVNLGGPAGWLPTADPGRYRIEYEVAFSDGETVKTWASQDTEVDTIVVRAQGDAA